MGAKQVIPAIAIHQVGGLTVDGNILFLITLHAQASLWIQFDEANGAEIGAVAHPKTTCRGVEQQTWVDGILILHTIRVTYLNSLTPFEIG